MAGCFPAAWVNFVTTIIKTNEDIQRGKEKASLTKKKDGKSTKDTTTSGKKTNNSKYKLTDEELKEHMEKKLCFKCHKPKCSSSTCTNPHTVYSKTKKKAQVANITTKEKKEAKKAKIKEVKAEEEKEDVEDFSNGD